MSTSSSDLVSNRRAFHDYEMLETLEAGIALQGTEIKSIRNHGATLQEAYVKVVKGKVLFIGTDGKRLARAYTSLSPLFL